VSEQLLGKIVTFAFAVVVAVVLGRNSWGKRHWLGWHVSRFIVFFIGVLALGFLAHVIGLRGWWIFYAAVAIASPLHTAWQWNRSRWIPAATRRRVIEKWERKTGKTFDSTIYELDHKIPFAKGGWHTLDNLRVVKRNVNRKKGYQEPGLGDWLPIWRGKDE
jgi:hypothetical protein